MSELIPPAALDELKARNPCHEAAARYVALRRHGKRMIGPCPICSSERQSASATRFECDAESWVCAVCPDGGDVIALTMRAEGIDFRAAVERLGGTRAIDEAQAKRLELERAEKELRRAREAQHYRDRERRTCWDIWINAAPIAGSAAEDYLRLRGIAALPAKPRLRCVREMPYYHGEEIGPDGRKRPIVLHRGPAMVAPIIRPDGKFGGLHLTYIDLAAPKGKVRLKDPQTGAELPAKKARGSKRGGYLDLVRVETPARMIVGEGIEKVLAVGLALDRSGEDLTATLLRTCVDLGNLGGKASDTIAHPSLKTSKGRPQHVPGPLPDLAEPGIPVPEGVSEIVILGDSTSDRLLTECAIARAAARWGKEGRAIKVAWSPAGRDFDDLLRAAA